MGKQITTTERYRRLTKRLEANGSLARERLTLEALEAIIEAMAAEGVSQAELARRCGVSRPVVCVWLNGENLTLASLSKMAHALGREWMMILSRKAAR